MSHSITIYVAGVGTPYNDDNGNYAGRSKTGHMWFSLNNDATGEQHCYGFHPEEDGNMHSKIGRVKTNDNQTYPNPRFTITFPITDEQYQNLTQHCQNTIANHTFGPYYGVGNACVDYTMDIMKCVNFGENLQLGAVKMPNLHANDAWAFPEANIPLLIEAKTYYMENVWGKQRGQGGGVELDDIMVLRKLSESMEKQHGKEDPASLEMREKYRQALDKEFPQLSPERRESAFDEAWSKSRLESATAKFEPIATKERGFDFHSAMAEHLQSNNELYAQIDSQRGVQNQQRIAPAVQDASGLTR